jgi:hypothetical protein
LYTLVTAFTRFSQLLNACYSLCTFFTACTLCYSLYTLVTAFTRLLYHVHTCYTYYTPATAFTCLLQLVHACYSLYTAATACTRLLQLVHACYSLYTLVTAWTCLLLLVHAWYSLFTACAMNCQAYNSFEGVCSDHRIVTSKFPLSLRANKKTSSKFPPYNTTGLLLPPMLRLKKNTK